MFRPKLGENRPSFFADVLTKNHLYNGRRELVFRFLNVRMLISTLLDNHIFKFQKKSPDFLSHFLSEKVNLIYLINISEYSEYIKHLDPNCEKTIQAFF